MANLAMRQLTFISFMCFPEWRGLLTQSGVIFKCFNN
jgi:hypothetical protein